MPELPEKVQKLLAQAKQNKLHPGAEILKHLGNPLKCPQQHPGTDYTEEALQFLEDEYVWFSSCDIAKIYQESQCSYVITWFILNELDVHGDQSEFQVKLMKVARKAKYENLAEMTASSSQLQAELELVRAWNDRQHREFQIWADSLFFSFDPNGKEQLLDADGIQVMMEWEKPYMEKCVEVLEIDENSHVLEIGFGCAYSAEKIQKYKPKSHTIIECSEAVLKRLHCWAAKREGIVVVEGTWQECLPNLGVFDCIFFDDFGAPGLADREIEQCPKPDYREEYQWSIQQEYGTHFGAFLNLVLRWHTRMGTRISGYLQHPIKMQRDDAEASYWRVPVQPPLHCNYFPTDPNLLSNALVPLFVKTCSPEDSTQSGRSGSVSSSAWSESQSCSRSRSRSRGRSQSRVEA
mmetsp:Transcript_88734/g.162651  ORF Transcript_88734/g.162651 Transcript_88734/m.162651 type:complete len:407 (+) Transcript_88734:91-1311(+)